VSFATVPYYIDEALTPPLMVVAPTPPDAATIPVTITTLPPTS
jgi:hypothetical protein